MHRHSLENSPEEVLHREDLARSVVASPKLKDLSPFDQVCWVAKHHQAARVRGCLLDATSANMILQVHARLNSRNQRRLEAMPVRAMFTTVCAVLSLEDRAPKRSLC